MHIDVQEARPWPALLIQQFSNLVKFCQNALSFMKRAKKYQLLLKFECISEDEVEVPMSSKVSRFHPR